MKPLVLMIDDNEWPTRMYVLALEQAGLAVKHCRTTEEALQAAQAVTPSALVVDIMIPPGQPYREKDTGEGLKTGVLLYADLRNRFPDAAAFILTNVADPDVLAHFQPGPLLRVVKKDDTPPTQFATLVRRALRLPGPGQEDQDGKAD
jgi:CheY-like chemotaxis protein